MAYNKDMKRVLIVVLVLMVRSTYADITIEDACTANPQGALCTQSTQTIIKVKKNKSPEYLNQIPPELQPKLPIVPAPAPKFN